MLVESLAILLVIASRERSVICVAALVIWHAIVKLQCRQALLVITAGVLVTSPEIVEPCPIRETRAILVVVQATELVIVKLERRRVLSVARWDIWHESVKREQFELVVQAGLAVLFPHLLWHTLLKLSVEEEAVLG